MDFFTKVAFTVLLDLVSNPVLAQKFYPALAKLFVAIRDLADRQPALEKEIMRRGGKG